MSLYLEKHDLIGLVIPQSVTTATSLTLCAIQCKEGCDAFSYSPESQDCRRVHCTVQFSTVHYFNIQYSTYSVVQCLHSTLVFCTVQCSAGGSLGSSWTCVTWAGQRRQANSTLGCWGTTHCPLSNLQLQPPQQLQQLRQQLRQQLKVQVQSAHENKSDT